MIYGEDEPAVKEGSREPNMVVPRSVRIQQEHLKTFGYTASCRKCQALLSKDPNVSGNLAHDATCRERIVKKMMEDPDLRKLVEARLKAKGNA